MTQTILALDVDTGDVVSEIRVSGGIPLHADGVVYASSLMRSSEIPPVFVPAAAIIAAAKDKISAPLHSSMGSVQFDQLDRSLAVASAELGLDFSVVTTEGRAVKVDADEILQFIGELEALKADRLKSVAIKMNHFMAHGATANEITEWLSGD